MSTSSIKPSDEGHIPFSFPRGKEDLPLTLFQKAVQAINEKKYDTAFDHLKTITVIPKEAKQEEISKVFSTLVIYEKKELASKLLDQLPEESIQLLLQGANVLIPTQEAGRLSLLLPSSLFDVFGVANAQTLAKLFRKPLQQNSALFLQKNKKLGTSFAAFALKKAFSLARFILEKIDLGQLAVFMNSRDEFGLSPLEYCPQMRKNEFEKIIEARRKEAFSYLNQRPSLETFEQCLALSSKEEELQQLKGFIQKISASTKEKGLSILKALFNEVEKYGPTIALKTKLSLALALSQDDLEAISKAHNLMKGVKKLVDEKSQAALQACQEKQQERIMTAYLKSHPLSYHGSERLFSLPLCDKEVNKLITQMQGSQDETLKNIAIRYDVLQQDWNIKLEWRIPLLYVILSTAAFIERQIFAVNAIKEGVWKRRETGLKRGLQIWKNEKGEVRVAILAKKRAEQKYGEGTYKIVTKTMIVSQDRLTKPRLGARSFTKVRADSEDIKGTIQEFELMRELVSFPGAENLIVQVHAIAKYELNLIKENKLVKKEKASAILEACEGDGYALQRELRQSLKSKFVHDFRKIVLHLTQSIAILHANQIFHNDLKPNNLLFLREEDELQLKVVDFGLTQSIKGLTALQANKLWNTTGSQKAAHGYYGSGWWTAPEFFEKEIQTFPKDFDKIEDFAVGYILYELFFGEPPPWKKDVAESYASCQSWLRDKTRQRRYYRKSVEESITQTVEAAAKQLLKKFIDKDTLFTGPEASLLIMAQLMRFDPKDRWSCKQAFDCWQTLEAQGRIVDVTVEKFQDFTGSLAGQQGTDSITRAAEYFAPPIDIDPKAMKDFREAIGGKHYSRAYQIYHQKKLTITSLLPQFFQKDPFGIFNWAETHKSEHEELYVSIKQTINDTTFHAAWQNVIAEQLDKSFHYPRLLSVLREATDQNLAKIFAPLAVKGIAPSFLRYAVENDPRVAQAIIDLLDEQKVAALVAEKDEKGKFLIDYCPKKNREDFQAFLSKKLQRKEAPVRGEEVALPSAVPMEVEPPVAKAEKKRKITEVAPTKEEGLEAKKLKPSLLQQGADAVTIAAKNVFKFFGY